MFCIKSTYCCNLIELESNILPQGGACGTWIRLELQHVKFNINGQQSLAFYSGGPTLDNSCTHDGAHPGVSVVYNSCVH